MELEEGVERKEGAVATADEVSLNHLGENLIRIDHGDARAPAYLVACSLRAHSCASISKWVR